eukprot:1158774-Pelagomonas_calceolata.AAC.4
MQKAPWSFVGHILYGIHGVQAHLVCYLFLWHVGKKQVFWQLRFEAQASCAICLQRNDLEAAGAAIQSSSPESLQQQHQRLWQLVLSLFGLAASSTLEHPVTMEAYGRRPASRNPVQGCSSWGAG